MKGVEDEEDSRVKDKIRLFVNVNFSLGPNWMELYILC